jgi:hypothetical protein
MTVCPHCGKPLAASPRRGRPAAPKAKNAGRAASRGCAGHRAGQEGEPVSAQKPWLDRRGRPKKHPTIDEFADVKPEGRPGPDDRPSGQLEHVTRNEPSFWASKTTFTVGSALRMGEGSTGTGNGTDVPAVSASSVSA